MKIQRIVEINGETPVSMLTAQELLDMMDERVRDIVNKAQENKDKKPQRRKVTSLKALANELGCSVSTVWRIKKSGIINEAVCQTGRMLLIDVDKVEELLKVSNRGRRLGK